MPGSYLEQGHKFTMVAQTIKKFSHWLVQLVSKIFNPKLDVVGIETFPGFARGHFPTFTKLWDFRRWSIADFEGV